MTEAITWVTGNLDWLLDSVLMVVGGFAVVATQTPNKTDDRILQIILSLINFLGANVGKASNSE